MAEQAASFDRLADSPRPRLIRLAYRLLGSVEEAEDVVQDAWLRVATVDPPPRDVNAYLVRTVTNLALDRLRHLRVQRQAYFGPWLPEPLETALDEPSQPVDLADDLSVAFLLLLERLTPTERVAYVLREAFDLSFQQMADLLGVQPAACRQRYHRARRKLTGARPTRPEPRMQRRALERLIEAVSAGDTERVANLLTDDAVLLTDGGGRVSAAIRPVTDPRRIAQVMVHLTMRQQLDRFHLEFRELNGGAGLLVSEIGAGGERIPYASFQVDVEGERVSRIYVVRNPEKLARLWRA
ncbi:MAG TPA: RNA polymerase sigma factor SigJ [Pseudomonadales bacterium]